MRRAKVFSGSSHPELSDHICEKLGISPSPVILKKFSNRETSVEIGCSVRNEDVFVIQSGSTHINDHLMELLIMISACKGASASRITAVMPYFPYSKQSKKKNHRGAITAKMVANLLSVAGVDHIITMDLHASQMQGFFNKPVDNLFAEPSIAKWIRDSVPEYITNGVVVSKNAGGAKRVTSLADRLKIDFALIHTDRTRGRHHHHNITGEILSMDEVDLTASTSSINNHNGSSSGCSVCNSSTITLVGDVAGKVAFIIDDMIDKAGSFIAAAEHLMMKCNAKRVYVIATHGILSGDSLNEIEKCKSIYQLVITNSFPVPQEKLLKSSKLVIIDVSATLAEAIRRTHNGESISYLFYTPL
ncbi:3530_t:CDS:2 [Entrophospora sp. SA101]|nr:9029_t:CDS:2 [Entrophospora sp. SA101]CAJ0827033.1 3530_t:CDS:2 [Entrophospora sp. SA101]